MQKSRFPFAKLKSASLDETADAEFMANRGPEFDFRPNGRFSVLRKH